MWVDLWAVDDATTGLSPDHVFIIPAGGRHMLPILGVHQRRML